MKRPQFGHWVTSLGDYDFIALSQALDTMLATGFGLQPSRRLRHRLLPDDFVIATPATIVQRVGPRTGNMKSSPGLDLLADLDQFVRSTPGRSLFDIFAAADFDGSHNLDVQELMEVVWEMKPDASEEACQALFDLIDADGNGTVTLEELTGVLQVYQSGMFDLLNKKEGSSVFDSEYTSEDTGTYTETNSDDEEGQEEGESGSGESGSDSEDDVDVDEAVKSGTDPPWDAPMLDEVANMPRTVTVQEVKTPGDKFADASSGSSGDNDQVALKTSLKG
mmetsp:Transcript_46452/g.105426  ORF Transcript_46452/g.105426 Transcript_46452/m.105426 type:complete len:278 (-) Transcript_46452:158-991(-)